MLQNHAKSGSFPFLCRFWAEGGDISHDFALIACLWRGRYYDKIRCLLSVAWCDGLAWWFCLGARSVVLVSCSEVGILGVELCSADLTIWDVDWQKTWLACWGGNPLPRDGDGVCVCVCGIEEGLIGGSLGDNIVPPTTSSLSYFFPKPPLLWAISVKQFFFELPGYLIFSHPLLWFDFCRTNPFWAMSPFRCLFFDFDDLSSKFVSCLSPYLFV